MSESKIPYRTSTTECAECGAPLTPSDDTSFDVCEECPALLSRYSHRILAGLPVYDPTRLTCATS